MCIEDQVRRTGQVILGSASSSTILIEEDNVPYSPFTDFALNQGLLLIQTGTPP
jgi:hypothetical protein